MPESLLTIAGPPGSAAALAMAAGGVPGSPGGPAGLAITPCAPCCGGCPPSCRAGVYGVQCGSSGPSGPCDGVICLGLPAGGAPICCSPKLVRVTATYRNVRTYRTFSGGPFVYTTTWEAELSGVVQDQSPGAPTNLAGTLHVASSDTGGDPPFDFTYIAKTVLGCNLIPGDLDIYETPGQTVPGHYFGAIADAALNHVCRAYRVESYGPPTTREQWWENVVYSGFNEYSGTKRHLFQSAVTIGTLVSDSSWSLHVIATPTGEGCGPAPLLGRGERAVLVDRWGAPLSAGGSGGGCAGCGSVASDAERAEIAEVLRRGNL